MSASDVLDDAGRPRGVSVADDNRHQAIVGVTLAVLILGAWLATHAYAMFVFRWDGALANTAHGVGMRLFLTWLYVGIFIVAHDCMHGALVPLKPKWNRLFGQICLGLYAGFSFDFMNRKHHLHHRHAGTADDPDFHDHAPHAFWPWYFKFFREYFSGKEIIVIAVWVWTYMILLAVPVANIMAFFTAPAIVSSLQLFYFGTYLPHKPGQPAFGDRHRSRSNNYPWLVSLLTCFHFGYHHEHHAVPNAPWWRLPKVHAMSDPEAGLARAATT